MPDVYQYETLPQALRIQIAHILRDAKGPPMSYLDYQWATSFEDCCTYTRGALLREYGVWFLNDQHSSPEQDLFGFLCNQETELERVLDVVELFIGQMQSNDLYRSLASNIINELNIRFREHGVGYQYESGHIIRIDSHMIHAEVVQPALKLLSAEMYKGANQEFLNAHKHYRESRYKDCLTECLKALESCIKAICDKKGWSYDKDKDTADRLIEIVFKNGLLPSFMEAHFAGLKAALKSGIPTIRNRQSGHGQGSNIVNVSEHVASYALHLTAANILLLARAAE